MGEERARAREALELDKKLGSSRARVLRAIQALSAEHEGAPEWQGATAAEIGDAAGYSERWARVHAEWLAAAGYVQTRERRDVPWRPTRLYKAK